MEKFLPVFLLVVLVVGVAQYALPEQSSDGSERGEEFDCKMLDNSTSPTPETIRLSIRGLKIETELEFAREYIQYRVGWRCDVILRKIEEFADPSILERLEGYEQSIIVGVRWPDMVPEKYARRELDPVYGKNSYSPNHDSYDYMPMTLSLSNNYSAMKFEQRYRDPSKFRYENFGQELYGLHDMGSLLWLDDNDKWSLPAGFYTRTYWPIERPENIGFHMTCPVFPDYPATKCTVRRDVTPYFQVMYKFHLGYLENWKEIDNKVMDMISSWMVNQENKEMLEATRIK